MHAPKRPVAFALVLAAVAGCRMPIDTGHPDVVTHADARADHATTSDVPVTPDDVPVTPDDVPVTPDDVPVMPDDVPVMPDDVADDTASGLDVAMDAPSPTDARADVHDAAAANACVAAGGRCVALSPGSCPAPGMVGDARTYSCGSGVGTECCLPGDAGAPRDAATDASGPVTCMSAGGRCVALSPGSCPAPSMVGDARMYTCGSGIGTECCLPPAGSTAPVCMHTGTSNEGWYQADGTLICLVMCAGQTATCQHVGTATAGWYTASGHGCPPHTTEIVHDSTCM